MFILKEGIKWSLGKMLSGKGKMLSKPNNQSFTDDVRPSQIFFY